jgi:hypothetical protein
MPAADMSQPAYSETVFKLTLLLLVLRLPPACVESLCPAAIFMQWCLPWLPTDRISRLVLLNTALPPHILFREMGLANALLVAIWQASVMIVGRYVQVRETEPLHLYGTAQHDRKACGRPQHALHIQEADTVHVSCPPSILKSASTGFGAHTAAAQPPALIVSRT